MNGKLDHLAYIRRNFQRSANFARRRGSPKAISQGAGQCLEWIDRFSPGEYHRRLYRRDSSGEPAVSWNIRRFRDSRSHDDAVAKPYLALNTLTSR